RRIVGVVCRVREREGAEQPVVAVGVWDLETGRVGRVPVGGSVPFRLAADGKSLVLLYRDRLAVWDVDTGKGVLSHLTPRLDGPWTGTLAVSPDGRLTATAHPLGSILWDLVRRSDSGK